MKTKKNPQYRVLIHDHALQQRFIIQKNVIGKPMGIDEKSNFSKI